MGRRKRREEAPLSLFSFQDIMACLTGVLILVALLLALDGLADEVQVTPSKGGAASETDSTFRERIAILEREIALRKGGNDPADGEIDVLEERVRQLALDQDRTKAELNRATDSLRERKTTLEALSNRATVLRKQREDARSAARAAAMRARVDVRPSAKSGKAPVIVELSRARIDVGALDQENVPVRRQALPSKGGSPDLAGLERLLVDRPASTHYLMFVVHEDAAALLGQMIEWARAVQNFVERDCRFHLVRGLGGHGIGHTLHESPYIANNVPSYPGEWTEAWRPFERGMLLAVEPMIAAGTTEIRSKGNAWPVWTADGSLSVHYEADVMVTDEGCENFTAALDELPDVVGGRA